MDDADKDEALWQRRFAIFMLVRLMGLAIFLLGVAIAYADVLRLGGWPQIGAIVALLGAMDAIFAPRLLKKIWGREQE